MSRRSVGVLGAGNVSWRYVEGLRRFPELDLVAVADVDPQRARAMAEQAGCRWLGPEELLGDPAIEIVVNLTPPLLHRETAIAALEAGKSVYVEKPLATTREDAIAIRAVEAARPGIVGAAPDTFLGSAVQTARMLVEAGEIGDVFGASAFIASSRAETWHPDPTFLFEDGGGPVLDLGPYFVTALVELLGSVQRVGAVARTPRARIDVTAPDRTVDHVVPAVPTHVTSTLEFASGAVGTLTASSEVWDSDSPLLELYGTRGTLRLPHPVHFDGDVAVRVRGKDWQVVPPAIQRFAGPGKEQQHRGLGVQDLSDALDGHPQRASSALAYHVLDILLGIGEAAESAVPRAIESSLSFTPTTLERTVRA
jgi:predicted dehydrogenase